MKEYCFKEFKHHDALAIAQNILKINNGQCNKLGIRITYEGLVVFQYLMDDRKNDIWLLRKEKTVIDSGHSSLYVFMNKDKYHHLLNDEHYAVCGGGYPIIEDNQCKGAICVCGLQHDQDHALIMEALDQYFKEADR